MTWNKKGKPGAAGQAGPAGQTGPPGAPGGGSADSVQSLRTQVEDQATRIADLETQLDQVTTQFTSFQTQACGQLDTLTDQSNAMGTAFNLLGLGGTIPLGLTLVGENGAPASLPIFSC